MSRRCTSTILRTQQVMISLVWSPYTHCTRHLFPHLISLPARANFSDITNENLLWHLINNWKPVDQHRVRVMEKSIAFHTLRISIDQCNGLVGDRHSGVPTPWQLVCQALRHAVRLLVRREKLETELNQSSQICPLSGHWHPAMTACPRRHNESPSVATPGLAKGSGAGQNKASSADSCSAFLMSVFTIPSISFTLTSSKVDRALNLM